MIKAILIDDEPNNLKTLRKDITRYCPTIEIVSCCLSGKDGLINIHKHKPDLIFLDIDMPAMTGFEMLQCLETIYFDIIFVTAHQQFAAKAFRINSVVDYLLKPIKKDHLIEAYQRILQRRDRGVSPQQLKIIENNYYSYNQILPLRSSNGIDVIPINEIVYAKSEGNYITIYLNKKGKTSNSPYCSFTLSYLEEALPVAQFCRIHQSYLININYVINYDRSGRHITLTSGKQLPVSNGGKGKLMSSLKFK